ncbi:hypothetical protein I6A84_04350 [Frankia sp. CNm7]|uniref:LysM domain-containing protein n=1 Tax=Frankia nepalensis TaxID=1836974 RepID=A0A937RBZ9_9ACTN|nr:hypothetical protein [Frankia nepalensis]MBL7498765.1 hypothetical protein [Frankia nepalensis]MBL7508371.1 hypothetical protein [Frankia nepalensis]MBL7517373.1 hypothetical protein [Frankia nepalensis]MBL7626200.1 hypothetical protein [Frankia nepalensis]
MPRRATPTRTVRPLAPPVPAPGSAPRRGTEPRRSAPAQVGAGDILRSLVALTTLIGFLAGVPALLWAWRANPLPTTWQPDRWWNLAQAGYIHPDVAPNTLAAVAWLLWAWLTLCIAWEIVAQAAHAHRRQQLRRSQRRPAHTPALAGRRRGRADSAARPGHPLETTATSSHGPRRGPAAGPPTDGSRPASRPAASSRPAPARRGAPAPGTVRRGTARWVAAASVVFTVLTSRAATASPVPAVPHPASAAPAATAPASPTTSWPYLPDGQSSRSATEPSPTIRPLGTTADQDTAPPAALVPTATSHTVRPGDTLWNITADAYPAVSGARLPAAVDTVFATNRGATDPAGRSLTNPDLINPGMALTLPTITADATSAAPSPPAPAGGGTPPGGPTPPASQPTATADPRTSPSTSPAPGQATGPTSAHGVPTPTPGLPASTTAPAVPGGGDTVERDRGDRTAVAPWEIIAGIGAGGFLAAALLAAVTRRRRRRDHQTTPDTTPPRPDPDAAALHTALLASTPHDPTVRLDHALRALAALHTDPHDDVGSPTPQVVLALPDGTLDVYLAEPLPLPPDPWIADAHGQIWTLPPGADLPPVDLGNPPPCQALVQLGTQPDGATVHADLEALGTLTLNSAGDDPDAVAGVARALLATLALSPLACIPLIRTFGLDPAGLATEDRIHPAPNLATLSTLATGEVTALRADLTSVAAPTTFTARATVPTENWDPTIAVVAAPPADDIDSDHLADLTTLAGAGGTGLAVLQPAAPGHTSPWRLTLLRPGTRSHAEHPHADGDQHGASVSDDTVPDGPVGLDPLDEDDTEDEAPGRQPRQSASHGENGTGTGRPRWRLDPLGLVLTPPTLAAAELDAVYALLTDVTRPPIPATPLVPRPSSAVSPVAQVPPATGFPASPPFPPLPPVGGSGPDRAGGWIPDLPTARPPAPAAMDTPAPATAFSADAPPAMRPSATLSGDDSTADPTPTTDASPPAAPATEPREPARPSASVDALNGHGPSGPVSDDEAPSTPNSQASAGPPAYAEPDWQVMIHLFGPADATNRAGQHPTGGLARGRTLEVLAWLATHRGRIRTNLEAAIWPDSKPKPRSLNNQLGRARLLLVQLAGDDARAWIPAAQTRLHLDPAVTTDLDLLTHRLTYARAHRAHPDAAIPVLTDALDLINGTPTLYAWLDAELGSVLTTTAVRAAALLAELHLQAGDPTAALDATTRGLELLPAHPELFALRLRAHHIAGDQLALTADYHAYLRVEQADPTWDGETNPDLAYLHRVLTRRANAPSRRLTDYGDPLAGQGPK